VIGQLSLKIHPHIENNTIDLLLWQIRRETLNIEVNILITSAHLSENVKSVNEL